MNQSYENLKKFVEVMKRKFLKVSGIRTGDDFYGVEMGGPDEAVCKVSDIERLIEDRDFLIRNLRGLADAVHHSGMATPDRVLRSVIMRIERTARETISRVNG